MGCILIENQKVFFFSILLIFVFHFDDVDLVCCLCQLLQEISSQNFLLDKMEEMQKKNVTKAELKQLEKKMIKHIQKNIQLMVKELFDATGELKGMLHHEESSTLIIADVKRQIAELKNSLEVLSFHLILIISIGEYIFLYFI